ncbi:hypothetical protein ACFOSD_04355 [Salinispirillum marinum]|uniref:DUF721 domain-containing protein n=2 Tax=Saccharospirillaceae TaxID=255527 RepID=A0ABV8BB66_9GAMM
METLNSAYFAARESAQPQCRVFLRAHLQRGFALPNTLLRVDVTDQVPALCEMSYQQHLAPLVRRLQVRIEETHAVRVRTIDVEVQYYPKATRSVMPVSEAQKNHAA